MKSLPKFFAVLSWAAFGACTLMAFPLLAQPPNPPLASHTSTLGFAWRVAVSGSHAYVANGHAGVQVLDISNPAQPQRIGSYVSPEPAFIEHVTLSGRYAYIFEDVERDAERDRYEGVLRVVDVSDPARPKLVGSYVTGGSAGSVAVSGHFAYAAVRGVDLLVLDVSDPANPQRIGAASNGDGDHVAVSGNHVYLAGSGLTVFEVDPSGYPVLVAAYSNPADGDTDAVGVAVCDNYAYVVWNVDTDGTLLRVFDISEPARLRELGRYEDPTAGVQGMVQSGGLVYLASRDYGLRVLDVGNPNQPRPVGNNPAFSLDGVAVVNAHLFAAAGGDGLAVFDLFKPLRLETLGVRQGELRLRLHGPREATYRLQRSTNLPQWEDWQPVTFGSEPVEVVDAEAAGDMKRFYRLAWP